MKEVDQGGYKYLGVLQLDNVMNKEMKESIGDENIRRVKLICKLNLNAANFISGINSSATGDELPQRNYNIIWKFNKV